MKASGESGGSRVSKQKSYVFAALFAFIVLAILIVFNPRPEVIEKIARSVNGTLEWI